MSEAECKELHDRLVAYVEKEKPYINPDLKMGELAAALHTSSIPCPICSINILISHTMTL